jgi:hypothetical protein
VTDPTPEEVHALALRTAFPIHVNGLAYDTWGGIHTYPTGEALAHLSHSTEARRLVLSMFEANLALQNLIKIPPYEKDRFRRPSQRGVIPFEVVVAGALAFAWISFLFALVNH